MKVHVTCASLHYKLTALCIKFYILQDSNQIAALSKSSFRESSGHGNAFSCHSFLFSPMPLLSATPTSTCRCTFKARKKIARRTKCRSNRSRDHFPTQFRHSLGIHFTHPQHGNLDIFNLYSLRETSMLSSIVRDWKSSIYISLSGGDTSEAHGYGQSR